MPILLLLVLARNTTHTITPWYIFHGCLYIGYPPQPMLVLEETACLIIFLRFHCVLVALVWSGIFVFRAWLDSAHLQRLVSSMTPSFLPISVWHIDGKRGVMYCFFCMNEVWWVLCSGLPIMRLKCGGWCSFATCLLKIMHWIPNLALRTRARCAKEFQLGRARS